jgi:broad specificity phosphatase PhoE
MLNIYIVRHGQDQDNAKLILNGHRDKPLTARGKKEAKIIARDFKTAKVNFSGFYVSPLKRARETAEIIAKELKLKKAKVFSGLIERDFGVMAGKPIADIVPLCAPQVLKTNETYYFLKAYSSETFPELLKRARLVLAEIKRNNKSGNVLLVTHGDLGKMLFAAYYHFDWQTALKLIYFKNGDALLLSPGLNPKQAYIAK